MHGIRLIIADDAPDGLKTAVEDIRDQFELTCRDREIPFELASNAESSDYYISTYRFSHGESSTKILREFDNLLRESDASGYCIEYHECYCNRSNVDCGDWSCERQDGNIPEHL